MKKFWILGGVFLVVFIGSLYRIERVDSKDLDDKFAERVAVSRFASQIHLTNVIMERYINGELAEETVHFGKNYLDNSFDTLFNHYFTLNGRTSINYQDIEDFWRQYRSILDEEPSEQQLADLIRLEERLVEVRERVYAEDRELRGKIDSYWWRVDY
ncbi:hypothetical protein PQ478_19435 [Alkalihalophilus pseudofirmus]|uniref:hypothetical protein n=1 Tax=Alkalihalophilus pseudofirmus TaxID=79885 RepID=UPI00259B6D6F|nr:hypothetical protein [Alkalihalophilus pseudofirmus]WEG16652.1 hypothetical protein PQ478_19435 [Alkalihalophilus pseudofirmus]